MGGNYIILQVRLKSTRLPGKLLYRLSGITIFEHILMRLKRSRNSDGIIVATTRNTVDFIKGIAENHGVIVFVGPEQDVLKRYAMAVKAYNVENVIRATGDNPLVCIEYLDKALELHLEQEADLTTYPELPYGTGIEVIKSSALLEADRLSDDPFEREHITQFIYRHEDRFKVIRGTPDIPYRLPDLRLTVDTIDDYNRISGIYEKFWSGVPIPLIRVLDAYRRGELKF